MEGPSLALWAVVGQVWGTLVALGEHLARTGLCHSSSAGWGARISCLCQRPGQSCCHRAGEFSLLQGKVKKNALCWSSGVGFAKAYYACILVE